MGLGHPDHVASLAIDGAPYRMAVAHQAKNQISRSPGPCRLRQGIRLVCDNWYSRSDRSDRFRHCGICLAPRQPLLSFLGIYHPTDFWGPKLNLRCQRWYRSGYRIADWPFCQQQGPEHSVINTKRTLNG